jgi:hypothetical protein
MTRRFLRDGNWGIEPRENPLEFVPRTEQEEARRMARDFLRDRDDEDAIDFEGMPDLG